MSLPILILCIVSMTSFNPVTPSSSSQLSSDSGTLLDFGFSRLIDDLVSANDNSTSHEAMLAVFAAIKNQSQSMGRSDKSIKKIIRHGMRYNTKLDKYFIGIHDIEVQYKSMKVYLRRQTLYMQELQCSARHCNSDEGGSMFDTLNDIRHAALSTGKNFMELLIEYADTEESFLNDDEEVRKVEFIRPRDVCARISGEKNQNSKAIANDCAFVKQSPQYKIYEIYHKLVILITKAYAMRIYGITLLGEDPIQYDGEKDDERKDYKETIRYFQKTAVSAMTHVSRDIRSCDLKFHQKGQKYIELKWLFNTIVTNEAYLNKDASCWQTCDDYWITTFHQYAPEPSNELNICHGRIHNCFQQKVDSYCPAKSNSRRFDGLLPTKMGRTSCSKKHDISKKVYDGAIDRCDQCICYCDDYKRNDTVRTFSLRAVSSDTSENRVITGIQFVERNRMIYLRIQEGKLKPNGIIEKSTVKWQPVDEFDYESPYISLEDFFMIEYNRKFVNFDTLVAPAGQVLTGIKLGAHGSHLALEIKTHAFNYTTGILGNGSHFMTGKNEVARQEITMTAPDNPIHMNRNVIDTRENTYVAFRMTDLEKDAGQTAIPFIDARPVVSSPPVPLSGAGIYYSGQIGYGGFIGLKAVAYNLAELIGN